MNRAGRWTAAVGMTLAVVVVSCGDTGAAAAPTSRAASEAAVRATAATTIAVASTASTSPPSAAGTVPTTNAATTTTAPATVTTTVTTTTAPTTTTVTTEVTTTTTVTTTTAAPTTVPAPAKLALSIKNFAFSPATVSVRVGDTVTWTNEDGAAHTATADGGAFDSGVKSAGQTYTFTATAAGTFAYHCAIHPSMQGTLNVHA